MSVAGVADFQCTPRGCDNPLFFQLSTSSGHYVPVNLQQDNIIFCVATYFFFFFLFECKIVMSLKVKAGKQSLEKGYYVISGYRQHSFSKLQS